MSVWINALQTPGIINEIAELDTLNRYISEWYESPAAKNRNVIASLVFAWMLSR
jgi:hypothetical protein